MEMASYLKANVMTENHAGPMAGQFSGGHLYKVLSGGKDYTQTPSHTVGAVHSAT